MKNAFKLSLIGFVMLTILLFGEMVIAQKGKPCYSKKMGTCETKSCKAYCVKKHKKDLFSTCITEKDGTTYCRCQYPCPP
ncbi:putative defensin-like protein 148 [Raphanus sativus]|uniref:Defensin-like protein 148 n=1 Tax=Raphanus sativus TaxID=3726 RepID=A0A9W3DIS2_RAPSA|nr:putative defensin-like protein 148 [Raphanus sativus]